MLRLSALAGGLGLGATGWVGGDEGAGGVQHRPNITGFHAPKVDGVPFGRAGEELPAGAADEWADARTEAGTLRSSGTGPDVDVATSLKAVGTSLFTGVRVPAAERDRVDGLSARRLERVRLYVDRSGSGELSEGDVRLVGRPGRSGDEQVEDLATGIQSVGWDVEVLQDGQFIALDPALEPERAPASLMAADLADGSLGVEARIDRADLERVLGGEFEADEDGRERNLNLDLTVGDVAYGLDRDPIEVPDVFELGGRFTPGSFRIPEENTSVNRIEITQSVQDASNTLPLVKGKETLARVFVDHPVSSAITVDVTIEAFEETGGSPHWQSIGTRSKTAMVPPTPHARDEWDDSVNFELPASWRSKGSLIIKAQSSRPDHVDLGVVPRGDSAHVRLGDAYEPRIFVGRVDGPNGQPSRRRTRIHTDAFERLMPVDHVHWFWVSSPLITNVSQSDNLIERLDRIARSLQTTKWSPIDQVFGMTASYGGGLSSPSWGGGTTNHLAAWGDTIFAPGAASSMEQVISHEINHNIGGKTWAKHIGGPCGSGGGDSNRSSWQTGEVGWSPAFDRMIPDGHPELMTYCNTSSSSISYSGPDKPRKWVSDYRWKHLTDRFRNWVAGKPTDPDYGGPTPALADVGAEAGPQVHADGGVATQSSTARVVSGFLYPDGSGELLPSFEIPGATELPASEPAEPAAYLEVDYGDETRTFGIEASFEPIEGETVEEASFSFALPDQGAVRALRLIDAGTGEPLDAFETTGFEVQEAGVSVPAEFDRGRTYELDVVVEAQSESTLYRQLMYSPDGEGWIPYSEVFVEGTPAVEFTDVPGGPAARFMLLVGDGVRTRRFESETFAVDPLPPRVEITRANRLTLESADGADLGGGSHDHGGDGETDGLEGEIVNVAGPVETVVGATVSLQAHGTSQQWAPLPPAGLAWTIERQDGEAVQPLASGVGERFIHRFERPGTYTVTVTGTDPATELTGTDEIDVVVSPPSLPDAETVEAFLSRRRELEGGDTPTEAPDESTPTEGGDTEEPSSPDGTQTEPRADATTTAPQEPDGTETDGPPPTEETPPTDVTTPGFDLGGALAAIGAAGYALKRRLLDDDEE